MTAAQAITSPRPVGRPPKITDPNQLSIIGNQYFVNCDNQEKPYLITELALALGFNGRQQLIDYENKPEFHDTIKALKSRCEAYAEHKLYVGTNQTGAIFALKNYGWKDKQDIEITHNYDITIRLEDARKRLASARAVPEVIEAEVLKPMDSIGNNDDNTCS